MCIPPKLTSTVYDFLRHFTTQDGEWNQNTTISMHNDYIRYKNYVDNKQYKIYPQADGNICSVIRYHQRRWTPYKNNYKNLRYD